MRLYLRMLGLLLLGVSWCCGGKPPAPLVDGTWAWQITGTVVCANDGGQPTGTMTIKTYSDGFLAGQVDGCGETASGDLRGTTNNSDRFSLAFLGATVADGHTDGGELWGPLGGYGPGNYFRARRE